MNYPHEIIIKATNDITLNIHANEFLVKGLLNAREKTLKLFNNIKNNLSIGINEVEARAIAIDIARDFGVNKHWHQPYIRFGRGTSLSFHDPLQLENILELNQPYYIDIGPVWQDLELGVEFEGDYGDTFILGENLAAKNCIETARTIFQEAKQKWILGGYSGVQIYQFIKQRCEEYGYKLVEDVDGHRISDFPHHKYTKDRLMNLEVMPRDSFWILELQINDKDDQFGAFYEDILSID